MLKTFDLGLNETECEMVKREDVWFTDDERYIDWKVRKPIVADPYDGDEFEWRSFDAIYEFKRLYENGEITDNQFVNLIQAIIDKRHNMSRFYDDLHGEPSSPIVKHEPITASFPIYLVLSHNECRRDADSIMLAFKSQLTDEEQWDFLTIIFDGVFRFDDSPRYYLHIFADDDRGYLVNPSYSEGNMYLMQKYLHTIFSESEIEELQKKVPHINLKGCMEPIEVSDYVD